ncbi:hypothetical protein GCM10008018_21070 [Paenibacillus marchantiophytorum]|uniref:Uncharacterized protein n=1 Tax=Paenibacillus marchantiophytorum TaxID=1619310 RepID=A0ABQ1EKW1_9BACL|nr:hypothetical protein [Paenibacillus marchantiophytorum]GFZ75732.1 hypothetical protein GCM10008018_21070 [Paenibacillus marchantiophytorum]
MQSSYRENTHSDAAFGESFIQNDPHATQIKTLAPDGVYYRQSTLEQAKGKDQELNLSNMAGRKVYISLARLGNNSR